MGVACIEIRGENFRGWLKKCKIRESFLPRKFPAVRYKFESGKSPREVRCQYLRTTSEYYQR